MNVSNSLGIIDFLATNNDVGTFSVIITLTDQELLTDTVTLNFTVNNVNDAPEILSLAQTAIIQTRTLTLVT